MSDNLIINLGKYKGTSIEHIYEIDRKYCKWLREKKWINKEIKLYIHMRETTRLLLKISIYQNMKY